MPKVNKEKVKQAIEACADFCCGECPYEHLDSKEHPFRCIHTLMVHIHDLMKENENEVRDSANH